MPWDVKRRGSRYCVIKQGESSPVPGGCHPTRAEAVRHQRALYAGEPKMDANTETFGPIPPRSTEMIDRPWDGPAQVAKLPNPVGRAKARQMYAWVDSGKNQNVKASYHFPHHEVSASGQVGPANIAGVRIGLARVPRAFIPEADRAGARAHLQRHLDDWHKAQAAADAKQEQLAKKKKTASSRAACETEGSAEMATTESNPLWYLVGPTTASSSATLTFAPMPSVDAPTDAEEADTQDAPEWEGVLAVEGLVTSDNRYLMPGKIDWRELPLTLMCQNVTADGHQGAFAAGKITEITRQDRPDLGKNAVAIIGKGVFANDADGQRAEELLAEEVVRHVSVDFAPTKKMMLDPKTLEPMSEADQGLDVLLGGNFVQGYEGKIMGATLCPFSAFEDATLHIVETPDKVVVASAFAMRTVLTASAAGIAPLAPPHDWFFEPETNGPCPLTVTADGKVYGHLALWNQCHRAISGQCEMAPRSRSKYAFFHTGALTTDDGRKVNVGRVTVGDGGHAPTDPRLGLAGAIDHYDKTGMVAAFVRATDGNHGIWLSGTVRSDAPAEKIRDLEANPPSGDWRDEKGALELCAALAVPVQGFPVPRYEAALVASGTREKVVSLVASGYTGPSSFTRADMRRFEQLKIAARNALSFMRDFELESEEFVDITADQRRKMAKSGVALPDGSFPIPDCDYAERAIRAQGRADPAKRGRVKAHIRKRVGALGCSGGIFDPYK